MIRSGTDVLRVEGDEENRMPASAPRSISQALPNTVLDGLLGAIDHRRRGRCPFPFELPGTCVIDLCLSINGS